MGRLGLGALAHSPKSTLSSMRGATTDGLRTMNKSYVAVVDNFSRMS